MRGIGIGQTIHLFIIPEIERLMARELSEAEMPETGATGTRKVLIDVSAWLVINSMRSERIQFNQLCIQNVSNLWRKNAFKNLLQYHKECVSCLFFLKNIQVNFQFFETTILYQL